MRSLALLALLLVPASASMACSAASGDASSSDGDGALSARDASSANARWHDFTRLGAPAARRPERLTTAARGLLPTAPSERYRGAIFAQAHGPQQSGLFRASSWAVQAGFHRAEVAPTCRSQAVGVCVYQPCPIAYEADPQLDAGDLRMRVAGGTPAPLVRDYAFTGRFVGNAVQDGTAAAGDTLLISATGGAVGAFEVQAALPAPPGLSESPDYPVGRDQSVHWTGGDGGAVFIVFSWTLGGTAEFRLRCPLEGGDHEARIPRDGYDYVRSLGSSAYQITTWIESTRTSTAEAENAVIDLHLTSASWPGRISLVDE